MGQQTEMQVTYLCILQSRGKQHVFEDVQLHSIVLLNTGYSPVFNAKSKQVNALSPTLVVTFFAFEN